MCFIYFLHFGPFCTNSECSLGDECFIYCRSSTACSTMILICDGICYLDCGNDTSSQCPQSISGNGTWYQGIPTVGPITASPTTMATTISPQSPVVDKDSDQNSDFLLILIMISGGFACCYQVQLMLTLMET